MITRKAEKMKRSIGKSRTLRPVGRPTLYTTEIAERVCAGLAEGKSLREICRADASLPSRGAIMSWAQDIDHEFAERYLRARQIGAWTWFDEMIDIADDSSNDWMQRRDKDGAAVGWQLNGDHVQRAKLRIEARKWIVARMLPRAFGDRIGMQHTGADCGPIEIPNVPTPELARWIANVLLNANSEQ